MDSIDIVALGETLIDFTPLESSVSQNAVFEQNPGGAPANVLAMAAKFGCKTAMISKVGNDLFGQFICKSLREAGIDDRYIMVDETVPTTLAFVQLTPSGERSFCFYRKPGADIMLSENELPLDLLSNCKIFHFGSVSLTDDPCKMATLKAAEFAREKGALISYDPNYRPPLWSDERVAKESLKAAVSLADVVKVSEEELVFITGEKDLETGAKAMCDLGPTVVFVTRGERGAAVRCGTYFTMQHTFSVNAIDTTGAGDAFLGAFLAQLIMHGDCKDFKSWTVDMWRKALQLSNAAGSLTTTRKGAIPAMPSIDEIDEHLHLLIGTIPDSV